MLFDSPQYDPNMDNLMTPVNIPVRPMDAKKVWQSFFTNFPVDAIPANHLITTVRMDVKETLDFHYQPQPVSLPDFWVAINSSKHVINYKSHPSWVERIVSQLAPLYNKVIFHWTMTYGPTNCALSPVISRCPQLHKNHRGYIL